MEDGDEVHLDMENGDSHKSKPKNKRNVMLKDGEGDNVIVLREEFLFGTGDVGKKEIALSDSTGCQVLVDATRKKISKSQLSICGSQGHRSHM
jgi:hypothetical protein